MDGKKTLAELRGIKSKLDASFEKYAQAAEKNEDVDTYQDAIDEVSVLAEELSNATMNPFMKAMRLGFEPALSAALKTAYDLELFEIVKQTRTIAEIATMTGAEEALILRIMRVLAAFHLFKDEGVGSFGPTTLSASMRIPEMGAFIKFGISNITLLQGIPGYLRDTKYRNPWNMDSTLCKTVLGQEAFEWVASDPDRLANCTLAMKVSDSVPSSFEPSFDVTQAIGKPGRGVNATDVLIVDVGGGRGQALESFRKRNPDSPGRLILQDLAYAVHAIDKKEVAFEATEHDFFTPQPVKGARFYHLRRVLHDWPDEQCRQILRNTAAACRPGYSTLLIHEIVLPERGVSPLDALTDMNMMIAMGMERNSQQWTQLLKESGFAIKKIWNAKKGTVSIIEAEPE